MKGVLQLKEGKIKREINSELVLQVMNSHPFYYVLSLSIFLNKKGCHLRQPK
jgi:hypothetical protein